MRPLTRSLVPGSTLSIFIAWLLCARVLAGDPLLGSVVTQRRSAARDDGSGSLWCAEARSVTRNEYIVGITYTIGESSLTLGIFGLDLGDPEATLHRKIESSVPRRFVPTRSFPTAAGAAVRPFFEATVVDLDGTARTSWSWRATRAALRQVQVGGAI